MMLLKCCSQYASKFRQLSSSHRTGKGQFSSDGSSLLVAPTEKARANHTITAKHLARLEKETPTSTACWDRHMGESKTSPSPIET